MISLGVDQSTTNTGMCLIEFDKKFKWEFVKAVTVETPDYASMKRVIWEMEGIREFQPWGHVDVVCVEWGYVFTDRKTGKMDKGTNSAFSTIQSATWCECAVRELLLTEHFFTASALEWRNKIWYDGAGRMNPGERESVFNRLRAQARLSH